MNKKHIDIRIKQCLALAEASGCPRRKFGALLLDPERNVVLMDGYNGGPRGANGSLCKGSWCERDGLRPEELTVKVSPAAGERLGFSHVAQIRANGKDLLWSKRCRSTTEQDALAEALQESEKLLVAYPSIPSGTRLERGCHHAEMNVVCNAAANGVKTEGAWLIVTGEPCLMCSKILHHAGITKVLCVKGGYKGGDDGPSYLRENGVQVEYVEGPQDPR